MKSMIETDAADALANGSTIALVGMAFFAVLREGLETAVFLLAVFQQSARPGRLGRRRRARHRRRRRARLRRSTAAACASTWRRFFRITGVVLVLVAAGLVSSAVHTAHEAGWLTPCRARRST